VAGFIAMTSSIMGYELSGGVTSIPPTLTSEIQNIFGRMSTILEGVLGASDFTKIASVTLMATSAT